MAPPPPSKSMSAWWSDDFQEEADHGGSEAAEEHPRWTAQAGPDPQQRRRHSEEPNRERLHWIRRGSEEVQQSRKGVPRSEEHPIQQAGEKGDADQTFMHHNRAERDEESAETVGVDGEAQDQRKLCPVRYERCGELITLSPRMCTPSDIAPSNIPEWFQIISPYYESALKVESGNVNSGYETQEPAKVNT